MPRLCKSILFSGSDKHDVLDPINCRSVIVDHRLVKSQASFGGKGYFINQKLRDAVG